MRPSLAYILCLIASVAALPGLSEVSLDSEEHVTPPNLLKPKWECDVRSWVRAPDLYPGAKLPADARLSLNGTECGDVVGWSVGLRLKERATAKLKRHGWDLPAKPKMPAWNDTAFISDWNDLYSPSGVHLRDLQALEYELALAEYKRKMSDPLLWEIRGQEKTVYDVILPMSFDPSRGPFIIEAFGSFAIHVPPTNYPPVSRQCGYGLPEASVGQDQQMLNTESISEFYHQIHLANGTILDIPAGRSGFIPVAQPTGYADAFDLGNDAATLLQWPRIVDIVPTRGEQTDAEEEERYYPDFGRTAPACDKGNFANFSMAIDADEDEAVPGRNLTLHIKLTRKGNGSEYPAFLDVRYNTERNITWAYDFVTSEAEYNALVHDQNSPDRIWDPYHARPAKMLVVPTQEEMERQQRLQSAEEDSGRYRKGGMPHGDAEARHIFWDSSQPSDEYYFDLQVPVSTNNYPSFVRSFEDIHSVLHFTLLTSFLCDASHFDDVEDGSSPSPHGDDLGFTPEDKAWRELSLPARESGTKSNWDIRKAGRMLRHRANTPIKTYLAPYKGSEIVKHYLEVGALGPVLSNSVDDQVEFLALDPTVREETKDELKKFRWGYFDNRRQAGWCWREDQDRFSSKCWEMNGGGGGYHAARLWQAKEARKANETAQWAGSESTQIPGLVIQM